VNVIKRIISFARAKLGARLVLALIACSMRVAQDVRANHMLRFSEVGSILAPISGTK